MGDSSKDRTEQMVLKSAQEERRDPEAQNTVGPENHTHRSLSTPPGPKQQATPSSNFSGRGSGPHWLVWVYVSSLHFFLTQANKLAAPPAEVSNGGQG